MYPSLVESTEIKSNVRYKSALIGTQNVAQAKNYYSDFMDQDE